MDKVIVITGGSRGIGAATALLAARQGYKICINYLADDAAAHEVLEQVRALGAQAISDFINWIEGLTCGIDLFDDRAYQLPSATIDPVVGKARPTLRPVTA